MLPPHELKNKEFPKVMRGYSTVDVDEHIDFIIEKYTELYRANDELERRIQQAEADLKEFKVDEESIRSALVNAQRASSKIISEANERADVILRSAKTNCDKIISEFNAKILEERESLLHLRNVVADFKVTLFNQYTSHIEYIEKIAPELDTEIDEQIENADYTKLVVERIKKDITSGIVQEYGDTLSKPGQESNSKSAQISEPERDLPEPFDIKKALAVAEADENDDEEDYNGDKDVISDDEELSLEFDDMVVAIPKKDIKKIELEKEDQLEQERLRQEEAEREEIERKRLEQERVKQEKLEWEKLEREKLDQEKLEWEKEKLEIEKIERERLEKEKLEIEKLERERLEKEKLEWAKAEREKLDQEKLEIEKFERERLEKEKLEWAKTEREKLEKEKLEWEKRERKKLEAENAERERLEREKLEWEQAVKERNERKLKSEIKPDPTPEPEPKFEVEKTPVIPEGTNNKSLSMKERIRLLNMKFDESDETDTRNNEGGDKFDDDYDDFVKTMEINKKKKNKPHPANDDK